MKGLSGGGGERRGLSPACTMADRCSTRNLQDLKKRAERVEVDQEVKAMQDMWVPPLPPNPMSPSYAPCVPGIVVVVHAWCVMVRMKKELQEELSRRASAWTGNLGGMLTETEALRKVNAIMPMSSHDQLHHATTS